MKKIFFLVAAILFSNCINAQENTKMNKMGKMKGQKMTKMHPDGVMMTEGKMYLIVKGKTTMMENEVTLNNGTRVMADGNYLLKDGTKMMLTEGDHLNLAGNMVQMKMGQHKKAMMKDGVMMKDGKMMWCMNNKMTMLDKEVTMDNGTKVMLDGNYITKNGSTMMLKEGEHMNMDGNISTMKMHKMKNK
jgi:uncharacterized protein YdeI (BOF family)